MSDFLLHKCYLYSIELYMGSAMGVVCVLLFRVYLLKHVPISFLSLLRRTLIGIECQRR